MFARGFTLPELLVALAILATLASFATPAWQAVAERQRLEVLRDQLQADLQTARIRALQLGQAVRLSKLTGCAWTTAALTDWSCGWKMELVDGKSPNNASNVLLSTANPTPAQITTTSMAVTISARGDVSSVGERYVFKSRSAHLGVASVLLCINNAGRIRKLTGEVCS